MVGLEAIRQRGMWWTPPQIFFVYLPIFVLSFEIPWAIVNPNRWGYRDRLKNLVKVMVSA